MIFLVYIRLVRVHIKHWNLYFRDLWIYCSDGLFSDIKLKSFLTLLQILIAYLHCTLNMCTSTMCIQCIFVTGFDRNSINIVGPKFCGSYIIKNTHSIVAYCVHMLHTGNWKQVHIMYENVLFAYIYMNWVDICIL